MANDTEVWFENPMMGQRVHMLTLAGATGGQSFVAEYIDKPMSGQFGVPAHRHPWWTETFEILSGQAKYKLGNEEKSASTGDKIVMPPNVPHIHPWNAGTTELHVRQTAVSSPPDAAGLTANLQAAVTIFGLARAGKVNKKGMPGMLQLAVLVDSTMPATYVASMPIGVQRVLFGALGALGRTFGYRTSYPQYGTVTNDRVDIPPGMQAK